MKLDKSRSFEQIKSVDIKQKVFFIQDGIDYDKQGNPCNPKQVTALKKGLAKEAQDRADEALADANRIQEEATATAESLGVSTKAPTKKAVVKKAAK